MSWGENDDGVEEVKGEQCNEVRKCNEVEESINIVKTAGKQFCKL